MDRILNYYITRKGLLVSGGFILFLMLILVLDGWGVANGFVISRYLIMIVPSIMFTFQLIWFREVRIPVIFSFVYLIYLTVISISIFSAIHIQAAFEYQLVAIGYFLIFLWVYNQKKNISAFFGKYLIFSVILTAIFGICASFFLPHNIRMMFAAAPYQLALIDRGSVNHFPFGALLVTVIPTLMVYSLSTKNLVIKVLFVSSIILLVFTQLRAAYLGLLSSILLFIIFSKSLQKANRILIMGVVGCILFFFLVSFSTTLSIPVITPLSQALAAKGAPIYGKTIFNLHDQYIKQAFTGIKERPLTGWGSLNFLYVSQRYAASVNEIGTNSHSQIIEIAVENGIPASVLFLICIGLILYGSRNILKSGSLPQKCIYLTFITLLVMFQFNFYYRSHYLMLLFIVTAALIYEDGKTITTRFSILLVSLLLAIVAIVILLAQILLLNLNPKIALTIYPLYEAGYQAMITEVKNDHDPTQYSLWSKRFQSFYPQYSDQYLYLGNLKLAQKKYQEADEDLTKALIYSPKDYYILFNLYEAKKGYMPEEKAKQFVSDYIDSQDIIKHGLQQQELEYVQARCVTNKIPCQDD